MGTKRRAGTMRRARAALNRPALIDDDVPVDRSNWRHLPKGESTRCGADAATAPHSATHDGICIDCYHEALKEFEAKRR